MDKEKNFISAVVYLHNCVEEVSPFFERLNHTLAEHFEKYELIAVDDCCTDNTVSRLKEWARELSTPLSILHMSMYHGLEDAMNAGVDAAIGDYVFEFDSTQTPYSMDFVFSAYKESIEGYDIVCICPTHIRWSSKLFYKLFNANSRSMYRLQTDAFRVITRRAINRVHASNTYMPYRKAAYAASGLKMKYITFDGKISSEQKQKFALAIDSLALYTNAASRISNVITALMMIIALLELVYTVVVYCNGHPIEGWTTMMLVMTFGFLGLFIVLSIVIRYLRLNLDLGFRKQKYLIESIEKIQK